jgi:hypothetical protein
MLSALGRLLLSQYGRKGVRMLGKKPNMVKVDIKASQKAKEKTRERFKKTGGKGMTLGEANTTKFKVDE